MNKTNGRTGTVQRIDNSGPESGPERVWATVYAGRQLVTDIRSLVRSAVFSSVFLLRGYLSMGLSPATIRAYELWLYSENGARMIGMPIAASRVGFQFAQRVSTTLLTAIPVGHAKMTLNQYRLADMPEGRSLAGLERWLASFDVNGAYSTLLNVVVEEVRRMPEQLDWETYLWLPPHAEYEKMLGR